MAKGANVRHQMSCTHECRSAEDEEKSLWAEVAGKDFKDRREMGLDLI